MPETTTPAEALDHAAELVREVNHTAAHHSAYEFPNEVCDAYGAMATLLERLPQAVHQHAGWLTRETVRGGVAVDSGSEYAHEPAAAAAVVEHHSRQAAEALLTAARELRAAHNIVGAMASTRLDDADEREEGEL